MIEMRDTDAIARSIRRYRLVVVSRRDDGAFRFYYMARAGSGSRGGYRRNNRLIIVNAEQDIELRWRGLIKHQEAA